VNGGPLRSAEIRTAFDNLRHVVRWTWNHPANRGRRAAAVARAAHFQLRSRVTGQLRATRIGGATILAERGFAASTKVVYGSPPDWAEMQAWRRILKPGDLFVDVGANVGTYTLWAADCGARVLAVEPHVATAARLRRNVVLNRFEVEIVEQALADQPGRRRMTADLDSLNHFLEPDQDGVDVPATTLDLLLGDRRAAGLKIDVEGVEELVLRGAGQALAEGRIDVVQLEWNERSRLIGMGSRDRAAGLLTAAGYHFTRPDDQGRLIPCSIDGYGADVFALRA
jgi:FkbM family methyltransferase